MSPTRKSTAYPYTHPTMSPFNIYPETVVGRRSQSRVYNIISYMYNVYVTRAYKTQKYIIYCNIIRVYIPLWRRRQQFRAIPKKKTNANTRYYNVIRVLYRYTCNVHCTYYYILRAVSSTGWWSARGCWYACRFNAFLSFDTRPRAHIPQSVRQWCV